MSLLRLLLPLALLALPACGDKDSDDSGAVAADDGAGSDGTGGEDGTGTTDGTGGEETTPPDGEELFRLYCRSCHGPEAEGTKDGPALEREVEKLSTDQLVNIILNGKEEMPAIDVTEEEAGLIVGWLQEFFGV